MLWFLLQLILPAFLNEARNHSYNKGMALGSSEVEELSFLHRKQSAVSRFLGWIASLLKCQSECRLQNHPTSEVTAKDDMLIQL